MMRRWCNVVLVVCFAFSSACSKRERSTSADEEWNDIQPVPENAAMVSAEEEPATVEVVPAGTESVEPASAALPEKTRPDFFKRLEEIKTAQRGAGEILLTGTSLDFDYKNRVARLDENVKVVDDRGELESTSLIGRFSVSNKVEYIEAKRGVVIHSENRKARAERVVYDYKLGQILLSGQASVAEGENRLSGERIQIWIADGRKVICEPNVLLEISGQMGLKIEGVSRGPVQTEIRADHFVYQEDAKVAELEGSVRVRDPRASMNCGKLVLYTKDDNEIDWIEAQSEVIIQLDDRKALAGRVSYHIDEAKMVLDDDPKVKQGKSIMTGDRILFWPQTQRMVCEPNARVLLYPDEKTKAKFLEDLSD